MPLNRTQLINTIARQSKASRRQLTRDEVGQVIDMMLDIFEDQLTRPDGGIRLGELGLLGVKERRIAPGKSRGTLVHPDTGEEMAKPSRIQYRITFSPTRSLRDKLKERVPLYKYEG